MLSNSSYSTLSGNLIGKIMSSFSSKIFLALFLFQFLLLYFLFSFGGTFVIHCSTRIYLMLLIFSPIFLPLDFYIFAIYIYFSQTHINFQWYFFYVSFSFMASYSYFNVLFSQISLNITVIIHYLLFLEFCFLLSGAFFPLCSFKKKKMLYSSSSV